MKKLLRLFAALALAAAPSFGAVVAGPPVLPPAAVTAAFGSAMGAQVLQAVGGLSLRSDALTLSSLQQFRRDYSKIADLQQRAAAAAVLGALALPPAALPQRLAATDLPPAAVARLVKVAARLTSAARKDPAAAARIAAERKADAALVAQAAEHPEAVLPADLIATFRAFLNWGKAAAAIPAVAASLSRGCDGDPVTPVSPADRPQVKFGSAGLPVVAQPTLGDDISKLWILAHDQSRSALIAMYNFDDMDMAQSIVAAAKKGQKQVIVGDYSNWFPARMQQAIDEAKKNGTPLPEQTPAMKLIVANLGPNLELHILKGLGSIGINHNKFTLFAAPDGSQLLQSGSFNYTKTSQNNHWENVVFTDDADRLAFYKSYHAWIVRRSRPYSPKLQPLDPVMDLKDPIPQDASRKIVFHGVPFPKASGSPDGGTEAWLVKAEQLVKRSLDILMFSPFPTPNMSAAIEALLAKKIPVRLIADKGQVSNAGKILEPLLQKGLQLKVIEGPDVVIRHQPWSRSSKMHEKVMIFDGGTTDALAKMGDSLNISLNALNHNFENTGFWQGFHAAFIQKHFDALWALAAKADQALIDKLAAEGANGAAPVATAKPAPKKKA